LRESDRLLGAASCNCCALTTVTGVGAWKPSATRNRDPVTTISSPCDPSGCAASAAAGGDACSSVAVCACAAVAKLMLAASAARLVRDRLYALQVMIPPL